MTTNSFRIKNFWTAVLQLKYTMNQYGNTKHEECVADELKRVGFDVVDLDNKDAYKKAYGDNFENLPEGTFISQPNGDNSSPDFLGKVNGKYVPIECKSSQQAYPTYNGGLPKKDVVYIFSTKKYDETTIYFAQDVVSDAKRDLYAEYLEKQAALLNEYRNLPEWKEDDRGFDFYNRAMYTQSGGAAKTNYFTHSKRNYCEQRVINHNW